MTDNSIMPFGIHKGIKMADVPASYLLWLFDNNKCSGEVRDYIRANKEVLLSQTKGKKKWDNG